MLDINDFLPFVKFVLEEEKESYSRNPNPTDKEVREKEKTYKKKAELIAEKIAKREGINYED